MALLVIVKMKLKCVHNLLTINFFSVFFITRYNYMLIHTHHNDLAGNELDA